MFLQLRVFFAIKPLVYSISPQRKARKIYHQKPEIYYLLGLLTRNNKQTKNLKIFLLALTTSYQTQWSQYLHTECPPKNPWWTSYETDICMCVTDGWYYSQRVPRTGWVYRNVKKPESVSDHMYRMAMMSLTITDPTVDRDRWVPYTWKSVFTPLSKRKAEKHINVPLFMCSGSLPVKRDFFLSDMATAVAMYLLIGDHKELLFHIARFLACSLKDLDCCCELLCLQVHKAGSGSRHGRVHCGRHRAIR